MITIKILAEHLAPLLNDYDVKNRGHGFIYIDHQHANIYTAQRILAILSDRLGVPVPHVYSMLTNAGWLNDIRHTRIASNYSTSIIKNMAIWKTDKQADTLEANDESGQI
ncbi:hypothetical protein [Pseudomonas syringae group genomosp. 3]|uniref:hypothetical protein n=1 Tax=Pseudomonas syringae group genomosp. 3 TaxID=251701 RepID=UPI00070ACAAC|nr:hypothetical protein [Pseudomonas syringae group genomosp. 3]